MENKVLKWFTFDQNNSGGYFVRDENVDEYVLIQAHNAQEAKSIGQQFMSNADSCSCCGERWFMWVSDNDATDEPMLYGQSVYEAEESLFRTTAILHHYNGRVEKVILKDSKK